MCLVVCYILCCIEAVLTVTYNLCFWAIIRKIMFVIYCIILCSAVWFMCLAVCHILCCTVWNYVLSMVLLCDTISFISCCVGILLPWAGFAQSLGNSALDDGLCWTNCLLPCWTAARCMYRQAHLPVRGTCFFGHQFPPLVLCPWRCCFTADTCVVWPGKGIICGIWRWFIFMYGIYI